MKRLSRETWIKHVRSFEESGLTAKAYAAEAEVNVHTLRQWKGKLAKKPTFVEVSMASATDAAIEIIIADGTVISVPSGSDPETLRIVLGALGATR